MATILVVCTGNICRSPACELLLQQYLGDVARIGSAGTSATVGEAISEPMTGLLAADGLDGSAYTARQLTPALARGSDIIIAMSAECRRAIVRDESSSIPKTLLLMEVAAAAGAGIPLAGATRKARVASIPSSIIAARPELSGMVWDDVPDPYGGGPQDYERAYLMIKEAVLAIDRWVTQGT
jgi:protein-tyrosine phosphatase